MIPFKLSKNKTVAMADRRVQLILLMTFLYLLQGILTSSYPWRVHSPVRAASLCSVVPGRLVVREATAGYPEGEELDLPAAHAPFFFQAIPINSADQETLMTIQGIGPTLAQAIIRYRQQHGFFQDAEEIANVPGVGRKRAAALVPFLRVDGAP